jgi:hypothetical protein
MEEKSLWHPNRCCRWRRNYEIVETTCIRDLQLSELLCMLPAVLISAASPLFCKYRGFELELVQLAMLAATEDAFL